MEQWQWHAAYLNTAANYRRSGRFADARRYLSRARGLRLYLSTRQGWTPPFSIEAYIHLQLPSNPWV